MRDDFDAAESYEALERDVLETARELRDLRESEGVLNTIRPSSPVSKSIPNWGYSGPDSCGHRVYRAERWLCCKGKWLITQYAMLVCPCPNCGDEELESDEPSGGYIIHLPAHED